MYKAPYYKADGKKGRARTLPDKVFDGVVNESVLHQVVKAHLSNRRQGTAAAKNRSAVAGGSRSRQRPVVQWMAIAAGLVFGVGLLVVGRQPPATGPALPGAAPGGDLVPRGSPPTLSAELRFEAAPPLVAAAPRPIDQPIRFVVSVGNPAFFALLETQAAKTFVLYPPPGGVWQHAVSIGSEAGIALARPFNA